MRDNIWSAQELGRAEFGDARLTQRLVRIAGDIARTPGASLPEASVTAAATKACYSFLSSTKITPESIRMPHIDRTLERLSQHPVVLVAHDITSLDFTGLAATEGLGYLQSAQRQGIMLMSALALTPEAEPLGLLDQHAWVRDPEKLGRRHDRKTTPIEQKQTALWLQMRQRIDARVAAIAQTQIIMIADREADIFEYFSQARASNVEVLIRATHNRRLADQTIGLHEAIEAALPAGQITLDVGRSGERAARQTTVSVRFSQVEIAEPKRGKKTSSHGSTRVWLVLAREENPPASERAIEWLLLSTSAITTIDQAHQALGYYSRRWMIERLHYTLKSGCSVEDLQLQRRSALDNAVAVMSIVAWRLLHLSYRARVEPDADASVEFTAEECAVLTAVATEQQPRRQRGSNRSLTPEPITRLTLRQAVTTIARLGGFLARAGDGDPGVKTLWKGLRRLDALIDGIRLLRNNPLLMGNG
jgi:hypothetical protein